MYSSNEANEKLRGTCTTFSSHEYVASIQEGLAFQFRKKKNSKKQKYNLVNTA